MKENYKTIQIQYKMQTGIEESVVFFSAWQPPK